MPQTLLPGDDQDQKLNAGQQDYDRRFDAIRTAEERAAFDDIVKNNFGDNTAQAAQGVAEKESDAEAAGGWRTNVTGSGGNEPSAAQSLKDRMGAGIKNLVTNKKKSLIGGGGIAGLIIGIVFFMMTGSTLMLPSFMQNMVSKNDTGGTMLERRMLAKFKQILGKPTGPCDLTKVACKNTKMPKSTLAALERKGIYGKNGVDGARTTVSGTGYADPPTHWDVPDGKGGTKTISSAEFVGEYKKNPTFRKAVKAAYNMRYFGWNSRYMLNNFFKKFGLKKDGGLAADKEVKTTGAGEALDKRLGATPDLEMSGVKKAFRDKAVKMSEKIGKKLKKGGGDPILAVGATACIAIETPSFIADTYRAIQVAQLAILLHDVILSPASMQQAGRATPEGVEAAGTLLTERERKADGSLGKSALDSPILLSAIGVNKNPISISQYAPGYALITNSTIQSFGSLSKSSQGTCNLINSPQAMVTVSAIEGVVSGATAGVGAVVIGVLKGIGLAVASLGAVTIAMKALEESGFIDWMAEQAYSLVKGIIGDYTKGIRYIKLGDMLGTAAYTYFPSAGLSGGGAVLKTDQVAAYSQTMAALDDERREEDVATLSPFDVSSPYTFLGSLTSDFAVSGVLSQNYVQSAIGTVGYVLSSPFRLFSNTAIAEMNTAEKNCSYAEAFGVNDDVAVNAAGFPCVGIPNEYLEMTPETVLSIVSSDIDEETGKPKDDSDIMDMMADCADADLMSISGCTINTSASATDAGFDERKRAAQSLYLYDYQVEGILSGEDIAFSDTSTLGSLTDSFFTESTDTSETYVADNTPATVDKEAIVNELLGPVLTSLLQDPCEASLRSVASMASSLSLSGFLPRLGLI